MINSEMTNKEMMEILQEKLDRNMDAFQRECREKTASELIDMASKVAATIFVHDELYRGGYPRDHMEYLLRFENPLELVRDQWISEQTVDSTEELNHALWTLWDKGGAEREYALDPKYASVSTEDGEITTVREFIEQHPNEALDIMAPSGYVYLTPENAQILLAGGSVKAHPGAHELSRYVPAAELLDLEIVNVNFSRGIWHISGSYRQELEQSSPGQGVTMS